MSRLTMNMTSGDALIALAEGNPGAVTVLLQLLQKAGQIDPDAAFGGLAAVMALDTEGFYGPRIWMLYKDVCHQDLTKTVGMLRAVQLGIISSETLGHAVDNYGKGLDVDATLAKVREQLPRFGKETV